MMLPLRRTLVLKDSRRLNKVPDVQVSDTTKDEQRDEAHKKIILNP
jgi:hypothetical protein